MATVKREIIRLNKKMKTNPREKQKNKRKNKNLKQQIQNNETHIPKSIKPAMLETNEIQGVQIMQGLSEIQRMQGLSENQGIQMINGQLLMPVTPIQNEPNTPQEVIPYSYPEMMNNIPGQALPPNQYISNQMAPQPAEPLKFGFSPMLIICPYCQANINTKTEETFNCFTCGCYSFDILLIPIILLLLGAAGGGECKDCSCSCDCACCGERCNCKCCFDVNHYCMNCGKLIGTRDSLIELCPCMKNCNC